MAVFHYLYRQLTEALISLCLVLQQTVGKPGMNVFVKHFISELRVKHYYIDAFSTNVPIPITCVCEETKCQLEQLMKNPLRGGKKLTLSGKSFLR
jgi:hypothetical protein